MVVGCAYGYLIEALDAIGITAYGVDKSQYAKDHAPAGIVSRITVSDIKDMIWDTNEWDWIISWNLLDTLDDEQHAIDVCAVLKDAAVKQLHIIAMDCLDEPSKQRYVEQGYYIKTQSYWTEKLPNAYIIGVGCGTIYIPSGYTSISAVPLLGSAVSD